MFRLRLSAIAIALAGAVQSPAANAQETISLRMSYWGSERDLLFRRVLLPYTRAVRKATGGRVRIQLFPGGLLGRGRANQFTMLEKGVADIVAAMPGDRPKVFTDDGVFGAPGMIASAVDGSLAAWRMAEAGAMAGFKRYEALALFVSPPHVLSFKTVLTAPKHVIAKTVRAKPGPQFRFLTALQAKGVAMDIRRVTDGVDQQVVDGAFASASWLADAKADELLKHHVIFPGGATSIGIFMMPAKYRGLPAPVRRALVEEGGAKLARLYGRVAEAAERAQIAAWRRNPKHKVVVVEGKAAEPWVEAARKALRSWASARSRNATVLRAMQNALRAVR